MISQRERGRFHGFGGGFGAEDFTGAMPGDLDVSGVGDDSGCVTFKGVGNGRMLVNPELQRIAIGQIGGGDASADAHQGASAGVESVLQGIIVDVQKCEDEEPEETEFDWAGGLHYTKPREHPTPGRDRSLRGKQRRQYRKAAQRNARAFSEEQKETVES